MDILHRPKQISQVYQTMLVCSGVFLLLALFAPPSGAAFTSLDCTPASVTAGSQFTCTAVSGTANESGTITYTNASALNGSQPTTVNTNDAYGTNKQAQFVVTTASSVAVATIVTITIGSVSDTVTVNPAGTGGLQIYAQNGSVVQTELNLFEPGCGNPGGVSQKTMWICLPTGWSSCSGTPTLTESSDTQHRLTITPQSFSTMGTTGCCANVDFVMASDDLVNSYSSVTVKASHTGYTDGSLTVNFFDNDLGRDDWGWELDDTPDTLVTTSLITGRIFIKPARVATLCHLHLTVMDDDTGAFTNSNSPYYVNPATCPPSPAKCICTQSSWHLKFPPVNGAEENDYYYPSIPQEIDIIVYPDGYPGSIVWDEGDCIPPLCIDSPNERGVTPDYPNCEQIVPPDASFYYPTFVMTAMFDHTHNFYDNNLSGNTSPGPNNPNTDNFNKIVLADSNLFPIHTAMQGDQEFPSIVMRNWTSAPRRYSPSVNDYMNRSVTAVANYIPYTTTIYYDYGEKAGVKAVGMRSYMQWVYALDPANNNFRRYKFVKLADNFRPPLLMAGLPQGDVKEAPTTGAHSVKDCTDCDVCHWYVGKNQDVLCDGTGKEVSCCISNLSSPNNTCFTGQQEWAFFSMKPGKGCYYPDPALTPGSAADKQNDIAGGSAADMPDCSTATFPPAYPPSGYSHIPAPSNKPTGAPKITFPIMISGDDILQAKMNGTNVVSVALEFEGYSRDSSSGVVYVLPTWGNYVRRVPKGEIHSVVANHNDCKNCVKSVPLRVGGNPATVLSVPLSAIMDDFANEEFGGYLPVDIYPCDGTGVALKVPAPPNPRDNAFRIAEWAESDPTGWAALSAADKAKYADTGRWAGIDGYLNTVPPESYPGYPSFTSLTVSKRTVGYGFASNTSFKTARNVKFNDPRDIDAYRDYFDVANAGPAYIFVADSGNSRIQVFMNATGAAGEVSAAFPIRPVPVKISATGGGDTTAVAYKTNEIGMRVYSTDSSNVPHGIAPGDGRAFDLRGYTTVDGASYESSKNGFAPGAFYYPHSVAVDQDPDTRDVYLFVADTYNHRIQVFRDHSGVSLQPITSKRFDFRYETGWGTYPLQTTQTVTAPGPFTYRYPKGLDVARFGNNSSYLYVADSKNYRVMKYLISENPGGGIKAVTPLSGYGYNGSAFVNTLTAAMGNITGIAKTANALKPGFLEPQDVSTGYSGFFKADISGEERMIFLNNYMVYVTDPARNDRSNAKANVNMRVMQFIDIPGVNSPVSDVWIPWSTDPHVKFGSYTTGNLKLGQSIYGLYSGVYASTAAATGTGSTNNAGVTGVYTDRPFGIAALQWNTLKPIDIRVVPANSYPGGPNASANAYVPLKDELPLGTDLRIGVSSRVLRFNSPLNKAASFWNASSENAPLAGIFGRWDALKSGRVHFFCYNSGGAFQNHTALWPQASPNPSYKITLTSANCTAAGGFVKIVAEDADYAYSARSGTIYYKLK